jgi:hypothetical protein
VIEKKESNLNYFIGVISIILFMNMIVMIEMEVICLINNIKDIYKKKFSS